MLTKIDALPIIKALQKAGYSPKLVGSVLLKGKSDNDIDIELPVNLEYDKSDSLTHGLIIRKSNSLQEYYKAMRALGFICIISPPFSENDTWRKGNILVDIWFTQPH